MRLKVWVFCLVMLMAVVAPSQQVSDDDEPARLLDRLAGHWMMTGRLGKKTTTHDVDAEWVLKREYIRFHEVSREKDASGTPAYEAIVFLSVDPKTKEYTCLWLDSTEGGGLSAPVARGRRTGDAIPLVFIEHEREALHTTFTYNKGDDSWRLTIDDVTGSKPERFGDVQLNRGR